MDRRIDGETVENAPKPEEQIVALIDAIVAVQPDILGVCELGDEPFLKDFQNRLKAKGIDLPHTEIVEDRWEGSRNLALLSRFPIVERQSRDDLSYRLDDTVQPFQRGILDVTVAPNADYRLRCIGLHLKSKREVREADQEAMRRNEAQLAREHIDKILADQPGINLLTYGDFNDTRNEAPVRTLQGRFGTDGWLDDLKLADSYGFRWTHHWSWADIYARIDFALVSSGLSPEVDRDRSYILHFKDWDLASDHRPLVVSLKPEDK
jgi:endonuclease/exonuclease/phosphatase family metal-dependent hydrolase